MRLLPQFAALGLLMLTTTSSLAEEWRQYRGSLGTGVSEETLNAKDWSKGLRVVWKIDAPLGFSSFVVADERAFTLIAEADEAGQKREFCLAVDANTGQKLWQAPLGLSDYGSGGGNAGAQGNRGGDGPRSTPTTDGKMIWVYDAQMTLSCFDCQSGRLQWKQDIAKDFAGRNITWKNASSPLLVEDMILVAGGGTDQSFLAFDKSTGDVVWKSGDETMTHATPTLAKIHGKKQVIFFVKSGLTSLDPSTGETLWKTNFEFRTSTAASPVVIDNLVYCSAGYSVGAGLFEVTKDNQVKQLWLKKNTLMNHWSTPVVKDGHLYGLFEFKKYGRAPLKCVALSNGEIQWEQRNFGPGNCILFGDKLAVLSDAGELAIVEARTDKYVEIARIDAVDGKCWSTPALSDGRFFVRSTKEAACVELVE